MSIITKHRLNKELGAARRPTLTDIAQTANVSTWTVSQVINGRMNVSIAQKTRDRVLQVASDIGYRPNHAARALVGSQTKLVAIWMPAHVEYSIYYGHIQHALQRIARTHGYHCIAEEVILEEVEQPEFSSLMSWPVDGVIACDAGKPVETYIAAIFRERLPIVNVGAFVHDTVDTVKLDLAPGSLDAARHLIEIGCKRIAFVGLLPFDMRASAYQQIMSENGRPCEYIIAPVDTRAAACTTLKEYAAEHGLPDGLLCGNDDVAIGCCRAAIELGAKIPADIAIVGCDGVEDAQSQVLPLSTVKTPVNELCEAAWDTLLERIEDPSAPIQHRVVTAELVVRESSQKAKIFP